MHKNKQVCWESRQTEEDCGNQFRHLSVKSTGHRGTMHLKEQPALPQEASKNACGRTSTSLPSHCVPSTLLEASVDVWTQIR